MSKTELTSFLKEFQAEDIELAEQLLGLRQQPGDALQRRIQAIPQKSHRFSSILVPKLEFGNEEKIPVIRMSRLAWVSVALTIAVLLFVSPGARAMLGGLEKMVGQIRLTVMDVKPTYTEPVVISSTPMSLAEARAAVPFNFAVPTYIPNGLIVTGSEVSVVELDTPLVKILWRDTENGFIQLTAHSYNGENSLAQTLIGPESSETILINNQPAVIVYGAWDESGQTWSYQNQVTTLIWQIEGTQYRLLSFKSIVSLSDLMAMAESVREVQ